MKRLLMLAMVTFLGFEGLASGVGSDMRIGEFEGFWCGFQARYYVQSQDPGTWEFNGYIYLYQTRQMDPIWIEQYSDESLRIVRYLQGEHSGRTQSVNTHPPEMFNYENALHYVFSDESSGGYGCSEGTVSTLHMPVP